MLLEGYTQELSRQTIDDQENRIQFNFTQKFSSEYNQSVSGKIVSEVRSVHGKSKWKRSMIKGSYLKDTHCFPDYIKLTL